MEQKARAAEESRKYLDNAGINIHDQRNLVPLKYWFHRVMHNNYYHDGVKNTIKMYTGNKHHPSIDYTNSVSSALRSLKNVLSFVNGLLV